MKSLDLYLLFIPNLFKAIDLNENDLNFVWEIFLLSVICFYFHLTNFCYQYFLFLHLININRYYFLFINGRYYFLLFILVKKVINDFYLMKISLAPSFSLELMLSLLIVLMLYIIGYVAFLIELLFYLIALLVYMIALVVYIFILIEIFKISKRESHKFYCLMK
jgi:hypothetical protein